MSNIVFLCFFKNANGWKYALDVESYVYGEITW